MALLRDRSIYCIPSTTLNHNQRIIIASLCIPTSTVSFIGAALHLRNLWQYRNRQRRQPSAHPRIVLYLALSDLFTCFGLFALGIILTMIDPPVQNGATTFRPKYLAYDYISPPFEIIALCFFLSSVMWTLSFAMDICFQCYKIEFSMLVYHILSWGIPLVFVAIVQGVNYGVWPDDCEGFSGRQLRLVLSYVLVVVVIFVSPVLYLITYRRVKQLLRRTGCFTYEEREALNVCKKRLFLMWAVFTICWFPNIITVIYDLITVRRKQLEKSKLDCLWYIEAFLNPLQGLLNYFVYRRSFKVSNESRRREGDLLRVPHRIYGTLDRIRDAITERRAALQTACSSQQTNPNRLHETTNSLLFYSQEPSTPSQNEPNYTYVARLLGEEAGIHSFQDST